MWLLRLCLHREDFPVQLLTKVTEMMARDDAKINGQVVWHTNGIRGFSARDLLLILNLYALQGYDHVCNDPAMMYRVDTMPGLGW